MKKSTDLSPEILNKVEALAKKYEVAGQDLGAYLDGLIHADYLSYWDYIHLDTLLSLQTPKTPFPDESIFIMYHQITELYFKLCLHEMDQLSNQKEIDADFMENRMRRMNNYFRSLTGSFEIMVDGMEKEQFLQFRMALLPASGFQSGQYRMIEFKSTSVFNLLEQSIREENRATELNAETLEELYPKVYWKRGATELATGAKTLTLKQFEEKYDEQFKKIILNSKGKNLNQLLLKLGNNSSDKLKNELRDFDVNVNINWPLMHYKSAVRYLKLDPEDIAATGGTNWQKYLPPRFQKRTFFPSIWSKEEQDNWGKSWVEQVRKSQ